MSATGPRITVSVRQGTVKVSVVKPRVSVRATGYRGLPGKDATITVGSTITGEPYTNADVVNVGTPTEAIFNFTIPRGNPSSLNAGTTFTVDPELEADVINIGTTADAIFDFYIPRGRAATADAGETYTGAPGSAANVVNVGTNSDAIFDFLVPQGPAGPQGVPGPSGSATYNWRVSSNADADTPPASGEIKFESLGTDKVRLAISSVDADGADRTLGVLGIADQLTVTYYPTGVPPATNVRRYLIVQTPSVDPTWVKLETTFTTVLAGTVPAAGQLVAISSTWAPPKVDEVWVGNDEPTDPDIEVWVDPDAVPPEPGMVYHNDVAGRDVPDTHPVAAITGLADVLSIIGSWDFYTFLTGDPGVGKVRTDTSSLDTTTQLVLSKNDRTGLTATMWWTSVAAGDGLVLIDRARTSILEALVTGPAVVSGTYVSIPVTAVGDSTVTRPAASSQVLVQWMPGGGGTGGATEVAVQAGQPTDPSVLWWIDTDEPGTDTGGGSAVLVQPDPPPTDLPEGTVWVDEDSDVPPFTGPTGHTVQDEGTPLTTRAGLNFVGAGVVATDDLANDRTIITIAGGSGLQTRATASKTTASLAHNAAETGTITIAKGYRLYAIDCSAPCRVRLYTTTAKRDADTARAIGVDPGGDHGLQFEFVATNPDLAFDLTPLVDGFDGKATPDGAIPITITNMSGAAAAITVTLVWLRTE